MPSFDNSRIDWIPFLILVTIGLQQFPVMRMGGSLRIYEILAFFGIFAALRKMLGERVRINWIIFIFFVVSPFFSLWYFWFSDPPFNSYQAFFSNALQEFRYMPFPATAVPVLYYFFCFASYFLIVNSKWIYCNRERVIFWCAWIGFFISILSLFTSLLNYFGISGIIQILPNEVQNVGGVEYAGRGFGLSQEPSFYVLYQGWIVLFSIYYKNIINNKFRKVFIFIQIAALLSTLSSALVAFFGALVFVNIFLYNFDIKKISKYIIVSSVLFSAVYILGFGDYIYYMGIEKVLNFFSDPSSAGDSGFMRAYTAKLGIMMFLDHPYFGVGPGASIYYMPYYSNLFPVNFVGEFLNPGSFPQNSYISVLSDLGIFGFVSMMAMMAYFLRRFWRLRFDSQDRVFLVGFFFTFGCLFSVAPAYSMFIWVFMFLGLNFSNQKERVEYFSKAMK